MRRAQLKCLAALVLTTLWAGTAIVSAQQADLPVARIAAIETPPKINGDLDDAAWAQAQKMTGFHVYGTGKAAPVDTEARLATDGRHLYVATRSHDAQLDRLVMEVSDRDGPVHRDDSVEVFLDPGTGGTTYLHFALSAANVQGDQIVVRGTKERNWDAEWESATFVDPLLPQEGWVAEMALPLATIRQYEGDGPWRINIARNKRTEPNLVITWAPVQQGFHDPENFGRVIGLAEATPDTPFAPVLVELGLKPYQIADDGYTYTVVGQVSNVGGRAGEAEIAITDEPAGGGRSEGESTVALGPVETKSFAVDVSIEKPGDRTITLVLSDAETGVEAARTRVSDLSGLNPLDAYPNRDYYTNESVARVLAPVAMPAERLQDADLRVVAMLPKTQGQSVSAEAPAAPETVLELPIEELPVGEHPVRLALLDSNDTVVGEATVTLTRHAPAPEGVREVKIDHENRAMLLEGKPFFPIGICAQHMSEDDFRLYREIGYNAVIRWQRTGGAYPYSHAKESLDRAHRHDVFMIEKPLSYLKERIPRSDLRTPAGMAEAVKDFPDFVRAVRAHPALIMYYSLDEAPSGGIDEQLIALKETIERHDPYHPVYLSGGSALTEGRYEFVDILGGHFYWGPLHVKSDTPMHIAEAVHRTVREVSEPARMPLLFIPQNEITSHSRRPLSPAERRVTVYAALINAAKSML